MKLVMFSGQGAQKAGMGKDFYDNYDISKQTFDEAADALGFDLAGICFEKDERLNQTEYAQPALLTAGMAAYRLLQSRGFVPDALMGLSLGEYTALCAGGAIDFADAVKLVHRRGRIMTDFAAAGGMLAVMGLSRAVLEDICNNAKIKGFVACANFNTPDQIVLAGEKSALDYCVPEIKAKGGKAMALKVSGPFHTKLMQPAADEFAKELVKLKVSRPNVLVISNLTAEIFNTEYYAKRLPLHMASPVRWVECVQKAKNMGITTYIELGSGNTLVNFVKKIDSNLDGFAIENQADLEGYSERLS